jgi:hypothetical protein
MLINWIVVVVVVVVIIVVVAAAAAAHYCIPFLICKGLHTEYRGDRRLTWWPHLALELPSKAHSFMKARMVEKMRKKMYTATEQS